MESLDTREAVTDLVLEVLSEPEFRDGPSAGVVLQAYLRDAPAARRPPARLGEDRRTARTRSSSGSSRARTGTTRSSRPASTAGSRPSSRTRPSPTARSSSSRRRLLEARPHVRVAIASHNLRSVAHAIAQNRRLDGDPRDIEFQVLRGLGDDLQDALASSGLRVRTYCPVGDLVAGMAYLVRRLLENTANDSFLQDVHSGRPLEELLAAP